MENNNHKKRKVMLIAAFAVAVIALAGLGYAAATEYKATTVNSGNTANTVYIKATQTEYTAGFEPADDAQFNTYTDNVYDDDTKSAIYALKGATAIASTGYKGIQLGDGTDLKIEESTGGITTFNVSVTSGELKGTSIEGGDAVGWIYIMEFTLSDNTTKNYLYYGLHSDDTWTDAAGTGSTVVADDGTVVKLYLSAKYLFENTTAFPGKVIGEMDLPGYTGSPATIVDPTGALYSNVNVIFTITGETA